MTAALLLGWFGGRMERDRFLRVCPIGVFHPELDFGDVPVLLPDPTGVRDVEGLEGASWNCHRLPSENIKVGPPDRWVPSAIHTDSRELRRGKGDSGHSAAAVPLHPRCERPLEIRTGWGVEARKLAVVQPHQVGKVRRVVPHSVPLTMSDDVTRN